MGRTELSDMANRLAKKFAIPNTDKGTYQGDVYVMEHNPNTEWGSEILTYRDRVCSASFQHGSGGVRSVQYMVVLAYLEGQLKLLQKTPVRLRALISGDLKSIQKTKNTDLCALVSTVEMPDFSEVEEFIAQHILCRV